MRPDPARPEGGSALPKDQRLNILIVSHLYPHGDLSHAGIFVREQAEALSSDSNVAVVVGRFGGLRGRGGQDSRLPGLSVFEVDLPWQSWLPSALRVAWLIPGYYRRALRVARACEGPIDIVHAHYGLPDGIVGVMLGRTLSVPVVVTLHGSDFSHQMTRPVVGRFLGWCISKADIIIGVSPHIAEGMREAFGLNDTKVLYLPNGYDDREIRAHTQRTPRYFLFVGSLIQRKNPDILLEAFALVAPKTTMDLVIAGDGPMMSQLEEQARQLGIASRVKFRGQVERAAVDGLLRGAAALVLPSTSEGMPIVVNEALASGTPVVASRLPGIEMQVRSEQFGSLVPPGDVVALETALLDVTRRSWDYALIARESGVVSWRAYAGKLLELYRSVSCVS